MDFDAAEVCSCRRHLPGAAQEVHAVAGRYHAREDFPEVELGAACLRILVVLPVEYEYPH
jgi:hypothetical protein